MKNQSKINRDATVIFAGIIALMVICAVLICKFANVVNL